MGRLRHANGKKRARGESIASSLSPVPDDADPIPPKVKKPKRAETRPCPACSEHIPIRLLAAHAELEMQRVEAIIKHVGDPEVLAEVDSLEEGPSTSKRRSAIKARQSLTALQPLPRIRVPSSSVVLVNTSTTPAAIEHTIGHIIRRRRARHARLKELAKEEEAWLVQQDVDDVQENAGITCPVCSQPVRGDRDVVEAHVDACLAHQSRLTPVERDDTIRLARGSEDTDVDVDVDVDVNTGWDAGEDGSVRTRIISATNLRGTGVHVRPSTMDTEDDIDIDGTDDAAFGDAQFGEADIPRAGVDEAESVGQRSNHDRRSQDTPTDVSHVNMDELDMTILTARSRGDITALVAALEAKLNVVIPLAATCRICLSPYVDPTVSTGCWHTCCAACWLKCLGTTKLCPMCQRITGASELRRVYL